MHCEIYRTPPKSQNPPHTKNATHCESLLSSLLASLLFFQPFYYSRLNELSYTVME